MFIHLCLCVSVYVGVTGVCLGMWIFGLTVCARPCVNVWILSFSFPLSVCILPLSHPSLSLSIPPSLCLSLSLSLPLSLSLSPSLPPSLCLSLSVSFSLSLSLPPSLFFQTEG